MIHSPGTPDKINTTYYVRDASGNIMAIYERSNSLISGTDYTATIKMVEQPIYGSDRLGERKETTLAVKELQFSSTQDIPDAPEQIIYHEGSWKNMQIPVSFTTKMKGKDGKTITMQQTGIRNLNSTDGVIAAANSLVGNGTQGTNSCSIEDENGNLAITAYTTKNYNGVQNMWWRFRETIEIRTSIYRTY